MPTTEPAQDGSGLRDGSDLVVLQKLGIQTIGARYKAECSIGRSFGGAAFTGIDIDTNRRVFIKYLICPRGEGERAKFLMERDALEAVNQFNCEKVAPELLHFEELAQLRTLVLVTEWVEGELLSDWLGRAGTLTIEKRLEVFHRVVYAMSMVTRYYQHRDFHPGNIMLLSETLARMGPTDTNLEARSAVKVLDWGESLPVIMCSYDDEPDHNFVMLSYAPRLIGGALTSLPPEVFSPWERERHFGGTYESWGLGMLLYRILTLQPLSSPASLGAYASDVHNGLLSALVRERVTVLANLTLPGGLILPRLFGWMMEHTPTKRADISSIGRVIWDVRHEALTITIAGELDRYFTDPRKFEPANGWKYSYFPDFD